jgi:flagellar biosynthesis protein FlhF
MMNVKKYRGATTKEAFALARAELGEDVVLLHQRTIEGDPRLGTSHRVEITAAVDVEEGALPLRQEEIRPFSRSPYPAATIAPPPVLSSAPKPANSQPRPHHPQAPEATQPDYDTLWHEVRYIRSLLQQQGGGHSPHTQLLNLWRAALREVMLPEAIIDKLLFGLDEILTPSALQQTEIVAATLSQRLFAAIPPASGAIQPGAPGHPLIFALVGPTGVGKTTTLAKLAARYSVQHRLPVALITADTFRIGAVGQLRTYSDLMRAPLEVAYTPQELSAHVARHQDKAIIFIDTPGRSPTDTEQLEVLRSFMAVLPDPHLQIAVAAGTLLSDAHRIVERFSVIRPSGILLTKLDETTLLGPACALLAATALPLSYVTTGQRVPEDIEIGAIGKLIDSLFHVASQKIHRERTPRPLISDPNLALTRQFQATI